MVQHLSKLRHLLSRPVALTTNTRNSIYLTSMLNVILCHHEEDYCVERFWNLESLGITEPDSSTDEHSFIREYQQASISREPDGRYAARFPRKDYTIMRLSQTPDIPQKYGTIINVQEKNRLH